MKLSLLLAAWTAAAWAAEKKGNPSFDEYLKAQGLTFAASEYGTRKALYDAAVQAVEVQNAKRGALWQAELNEHSVKTHAEKQTLFGYMKQTGKDRTATFRSGRSAVALPTKWDWRDHRPIVVTAVKNQGACGSCWAFATAAALESAIAIATGALMDLSPQQLTSCTPNPQECGGSGGCSGATSQLGFNYAIKAGITSQWAWPYQSGLAKTSEECFPLTGKKVPHAGITGYHQLPQNDAEALLQAVLVSPVAVSVAASPWGSYKSGIFDGCDTARPIINHAVVLVGYGEDGGSYYWTIRNSWGTTWGEFGYIRLLRSPGNEPCGVDDEPLDGYACKSNRRENITACGMCGVLADSAFPTGGFLGPPQGPPDDPAINQHPSLSQVQRHDMAGGVPEGADGASFLQTPSQREL